MNSHAFLRVRPTFRWILALLVFPFAEQAFGQAGNPQASADKPSPALSSLNAYFAHETARLADACLADVHTLEDWTSKRDQYRKQLFDMLGLEPLPEHTNLAAVTTGTLERPEFTVYKVHFESLPGLYVTGNLFVPRGLAFPAPTILYLCGHSRQVRDGVSYGNKVGYQHHPARFARDGYVCLAIDTLQLGEIEGEHHGTYRKNMWWWNSRGYTPAGVEAWNSIRALDYLESLPVVDRNRIGVTGRSGGGAYSWWLAALDDRVKVAVPVAGITDLENYVVDGAIEGHCDCMFMVNTYCWDLPQVAALVAPRPLLISNSDKDHIFPLDGVMRVHGLLKKIYDLYGAGDKLGINITEGPHKDTQELRLHAFTWFNRFLKGENPLVDNSEIPLFEPAELRVFQELPSDQLNTRIQETFVAKTSAPQIPQDAADWSAQCERCTRQLLDRSFRGWPTKETNLNMTRRFDESRLGIRLQAFEFDSQPFVRLPLIVISSSEPAAKAADVTLEVLDQAGWDKWLALLEPAFPRFAGGAATDQPATAEPPAETLERARILGDSGATRVLFAPRGVGPSAWNVPEREQVHLRRRFMLLGQTLAGMQIWDARGAIRAVNTLDDLKEARLTVIGPRDQAVTALYASLFEPQVAKLELVDPPASHEDGPDLLNVLRVTDIPQVAAMVAERALVRIETRHPEAWRFPQQIASQLAWPKDRLEVTAASGEVNSGTR